MTRAILSLALRVHTTLQHVENGCPAVFYCRLGFAYAPRLTFTDVASQFEMLWVYTTITIMNKLTSPQSEQELLTRCHRIAGKTLAELAQTYHQKIPSSLTQAKGFMGQLIERALGANGLNLPEPDFPNLGIELKTLPLNTNGQPRESTYVCTAPLGLSAEIEPWENSRVRKKLARVLWVPIEADPNIPLINRRIGTALLWSPSPTIESILRQDWEELTLMLHLGQIANLSAKIGTYLQIRPKAAHSRILSPAINEQCEAVRINPKGFYLRSSLTQKILKENYCS